jgi:RND family efflux transporter MFP subunit
MKKYKKRIIWVVLIIAVAGGGFWYFKGRPKKVEYTTSIAERGTLAETVAVTGEVTAVNQSDLSFKSSGTVGEVLVNIGDKVTIGDRLATLDPSILEEQLREAKADLANQKNTLASMEHKPSTYKFFQKEAQKEVIKKAEAALAAVRRQFEELNIISPMDGVVVKRLVDPGENAVMNSPILSVADISELELKANVPESDIVKVSLNQTAQITFDAFSTEEKFEARVTEIEPASTVIQDVVYYKVKLKLNDVDSRLKVGMSSDVDIRTAEKKDVIMIPLRAVKTEGDKKYVEILKDEKNNIIEKVFIVTGLSGDEGMVEVVSGLKGGEKVITLTK